MMWRKISNNFQKRKTKKRMNLILSKLRISQQTIPWTLLTDTQKTGKDYCNVQN